MIMAQNLKKFTRDVLPRKNHPFTQSWTRNRGYVLSWGSRAGPDGARVPKRLPDKQRGTAFNGIDALIGIVSTPAWRRTNLVRACLIIVIA